MIINTISYHTQSAIGSVLRYIFAPLKSFRHDKQLGFVYTHNLKGDTIKEWEQEFVANEQFRKIKKKNSVIIRQVILSFHPRDTPYLTRDILRDLTRYFVESYNQNLVGAFTIHTDTDNIHIQGCVAGLEYRSGKAARHTKTEFEQLKQSVERYQIETYPQLQHSQVQTGRSRVSLPFLHKEYWFRKRTRRNTITDMLRSHIAYAFDEATSTLQWIEQLQSQGITLYYRRGTLTGVKFNNKKYRFKRLGFSDCIERLQELEQRCQAKESQSRQQDTEYSRTNNYYGR